MGAPPDGIDISNMVWNGMHMYAWPLLLMVQVAPPRCWPASSVSTRVGLPNVLLPADEIMMMMEGQGMQRHTRDGRKGQAERERETGMIMLLIFESQSGVHKKEREERERVEDLKGEWKWAVLKVAVGCCHMSTFAKAIFTSFYSHPSVRMHARSATAVTHLCRRCSR